MDRNDLINLVKQIQNSSGDEKEVDDLVKEFIENVPDPEALDYLFSKQYDGWSADQIVDKALMYKPFLL